MTATNAQTHHRPLYGFSSAVVVAGVFFAVSGCEGKLEDVDRGAGVGAGTGTTNPSAGSGGRMGGSTGTGSGPGSGSGGESGGRGASGGTGAGPAQPPATGDPAAAGPHPLRRLTAREYRNTIRDLLGDTTSVTLDDVPGEADDISNNAFPFRQPTPIGTADAGSFQLAAETLARNLGTRLSTILPCTPANAGAEAGCAMQFIESFGLKAFRRPLTSAEIASFNGLYQTGRSTLALDFNGAISLVVEAMLQSAPFLYHWEIDAAPTVREGNVVRLGPYQLASRLSYYLWGSMPDPALFAAAASGQLATIEGLREQADRMLRDGRAQDMIADFVSDWLDVNTISIRPKDTALYPMWNPDLIAAMEAEFRSFSTSVITGTGLLKDLLTSTRSSVNQPLAAIYGVAGVSGTAPRPVTFNAAERSGLLTLAGFLATTGVSNGSSPVVRGHAVYTRLLCASVPDPPNNVPPAKPPTPGLTTRQRFEEHDMNPCTGACHAAMDPIGFGFERYDGIGRYRTTDQNLPVDSTGAIVLDGERKTFADAIELSKLLANSAQVAACVSKQLMRYALNRWDSTADAYSIQEAQAAFQSSGGDIRKLITSIATTRTFRYRAPAAQEILR